MDILALNQNLKKAIIGLTREEKTKGIGCLKLENNTFKFIKKQLIQRLICELQADNNLIGLKSNTDLIPGVYEGGFKIWESTQDMIQYVNQNDIINPDFSILEIGCGGGLVGINAIMRGSKCVHFQDFNYDVINWFTIPNLIINMQSNDERGWSSFEKELESRCCFMAGDWSAVEEYIVKTGLKYDLILSCETIYNLDNYSKLLKLITNSLSDKGKALIGAKSYYFGVGGGVEEFIQFVKDNSNLDCSIVKVIEAPLQRNILELVFIQT